MSAAPTTTRPSLAERFGDLAVKALFIIYELRAKADGRPGTDKTPISPTTRANVDAHVETNRMTLAEAESWVARGVGHGVGYVLTEAASTWALDLDHCVINGAWAPYVAPTLALFPGAFVEVSQSGAGLHVLGSYIGGRALHRTRCRELRAELYTSARFIALTGINATGAVGTDHTVALAQFIVERFPPRENEHDESDHGGPVVGYNGPADDAKLIEVGLRMSSAGSTFGTKATFTQLYHGDMDALARAFPPQTAGQNHDGSAADLALFNHLAFLTGNDAPRMERIALTSALVRPKWQRVDYLQGTIRRACAGTTQWYAGTAPPSSVPPPPPPSPNAPASPPTTTTTEPSLVALRPMVAYGRPTPLRDAYAPVRDLLLEHAEKWKVLGYAGSLRTPWLAPREGFHGRDVGSLELQELGSSGLRNVLTQHVDFWRVSNGNRVSTDAPVEVCSALVASPQDWPAIAVDRIATTPIFDRAGNLITKRGHHRDARVYIDAPPGVQLDPSRDRAAQHLAYIASWLDEFRFASDLDRATALCALMTAACRASLPHAPGFLIDKPTYGSGGSTLCDLLAVVLTGRPAVVTSLRGRDSGMIEELDKAIDAAQLAGRPSITIDNVPAGLALTSIALSQLLSQGTRSARVLGQSRVVDVTCSQFVLVNGNNVGVAADLVRRFLRSRLDTQLERPEARVFKRPELIADAARDRSAILSAVYSLVAAYRASGERVEVHLANFEPWSQMCVAPLVWCGLPNPITTQETIAAADDGRELHAEMVREIWAARASEWWRVREITALSTQRPSLLALLTESELLNHPKAFGKWLSAHKDRVVDGMKIERSETANAKWRVRPV
jgi:putative DNA primase/helicase